MAALVTPAKTQPPQAPRTLRVLLPPTIRAVPEVTRAMTATNAIKTTKAVKAMKAMKATQMMGQLAIQKVEVRTKRQGQKGSQP